MVKAIGTPSADTVMNRVGITGLHPVGNNEREVLCQVSFYHMAISFMIATAGALSSLLLL